MHVRTKVSALLFSPRTLGGGHNLNHYMEESLLAEQEYFPDKIEEKANLLYFLILYSRALLV